MESLRLTRKRTKLKLHEVGALVGLTDTGLSLIETGISNPTPRTRQKLSRLFGVPINYLDAPNIPKSNIKKTWSDSEREARRLIKFIKGLDPKDKNQFIDTVIQLLTKLKTIGGKNG